MKKTFFLLIVLVGLGYNASSQVSGGIKGGLNFANIDSDIDPDGKTGYHAGVYLKVGFAGISLQPEVLYSVKGAEDFEVTYIDVPIVLQKNFAKVLNIHLGPQFSFLTKAEGITEIDLFTGDTTKGDIKDQLKSSDLSILFGAGVNLPG
ncbi:outer membrane beta-barrel protein, partial [Fulvivirga sp.]